MNSARELIPFADDPYHSLPALPSGLVWQGPVGHSMSTVREFPSAPGVYAFCLQFAPYDLPLPFYFGKGVNLLNRIPKYHRRYADRVRKGENRAVHDVLATMPAAYVRLYWFTCTDCEAAEEALLKEQKHLWLVNKQHRKKARVDCGTATGLWQSIGAVLRHETHGPLLT